jgi:hypothetical protein
MYSISNVAARVAKKVGTITMNCLYREAREMAWTWTFWESAGKIVCSGGGHVEELLREYVDNGIKPRIRFVQPGRIHWRLPRSSYVPSWVVHA